MTIKVVRFRNSLLRVVMSLQKRKIANVILCEAYFFDLTPLFYWCGRDALRWNSRLSQF